MNDQGGYLEIDGKSIMSLMRIVGRKGAQYGVRVEGEDEEARRFALRMYSGLTSQKSKKVNFERYEKKG